MPKREPKEHPEGSPERQRTAPSVEPLKGGAYSEQGERLEKLDEE